MQTKETQRTDVTLTETELKRLATAAWNVRTNAYILGKTQVGAAVLSSSGDIFVGCNVEHRFRSHDVHAEVNAITNMIAGGQQGLVAIFVAAERERFTPCGSCLDWIFQFGGEQCLVAYQTSSTGEIFIHTAHDLMPFYPR